MSPPRLPLIQVARDGKVIGEYSLANLGQALRQKSVLLTDHYWREGNKDWERVRFIADEAEAEVAKNEPSIIPPPPLPGTTINPTYAGVSGGVLIFVGLNVMLAFQGKTKVIEVGYNRRPAIVSEGHPFFTPLGVLMLLGGVALLVVAFLNRKR